MFVPCLLLFPLVGVGFNHSLIFVSRFRFRLFLKIFLLLFFIIFPVGKSINDAYGQDDLMKNSGEWLKSQCKLNDIRILCNDSRIPFYAGRGLDYVVFDDLKNGYSEGIVLSQDPELFIYKIPNKQLDSFGGVLGFTLVKKIEGKKNTVLFYRR
jgi:hypothetical protein